MPHTPLENIFVGREDEEKRYQEFLQQTPSWVLMVTGQPGNGKSALLRRYASQTPRAIARVHLDFSNDTLCINALAVLEYCAEQLKADPQAIAAFEQALVQARSLLRPPDSIHQSINASDSAQVSGIQLSVSIANEQRQQALVLAQSAFLTLVNTIHETCLVILLDTCERLQQTDRYTLNDVGKWLITDMLPRLHSRLAQHNCTCLIVAAGRFPLPFENILIHELPLPFLKEDAVEDYLQQVNMNDATLRRQVYELTHGHALCIAIIASLWQERGEQPFTLTDVPTLQGQFTERALLKFIGERILNKRLQTPFYELTRYGILLRSFDLPLLRAVFPELQLRQEQFERLKQYPYVESQGNGYYAIHDLLRELLAGDIRHQEPEQWQMYHQRALNYLEQRTPNMPIQYYHMLALSETRGFAQWYDIVQATQLRGERDQLAALLQVASDKTLELSSRTRAHLTHERGRYNYYGANMQAALESYAHALDLFQQVGDRLGEANVLQAIGDVQQFRKDMQAALESYAHALDLFQQVGDRLGEANVRKAIGDVQQFRDEREAALESYAHALDLFQQVGDRLGEANCYHALGLMTLQLGEYDESLKLFAESYQLYQDIQDGYSQARLLYYRSFVHEAKGELPLAITDVETALVISQRLQLPFLERFQQRLDDLHGKIE